MKNTTWLCLIVAVVIGYALGVYFPSYGQKAVAAVSGSV